MTKHTKIPVPDKDSDSLIERAVERFDLGRFLPPPVPTNLAPPVVKPALRRARVVESVPGEVLPPLTSAQASPHPQSVQTQPGQPQPVQTQPEPAQVQQQPQPSQAVELRAETAVMLAPAYNGIYHPIDRARLKQQGMIVPEGSVTALLEEFRIIKRQLLLQAAELRQHHAGAAAQRVLVCSR